MVSLFEVYSKHPKVCFVQIRLLKLLRQYVTQDTTLMAANGLIGNHLDYCNSFLRGISGYDLHKLQCIQNSHGRIITNTTKYKHITPVRKTFYWLPIEYCSVFKTVLQVNKFLQSGNHK